MAEPSDEHLREHQELLHRRQQVHLSVKSGLDSNSLAEAGWGVVVADSEPDEVLDALGPLIDWRCDETGDASVRKFVYRKEESKHAFLSRYDLAPGPVDPARVPYYLLIVGPPTDIPFSIQQALGVQHAVGRLDLAAIDDYRSYAQHVVHCEQAKRRLERRLALFGPRHDEVTAQSTKLLAHLQEVLAGVEGWGVESFLGSQADRRRHLDLVVGTSPPAFLLSVCHGKGFPLGHPDQRTMQGAQMCQPPDMSSSSYPCVAGGDIDPRRSGSQGQIFFMNSCFSAGTPRHNSYRHRGGNEKELCAEEPFTAHLAQQMLAHPEGALAIIGHVDRTWNYTFRWPGVRRHTTVFESASWALMQGQRVGMAIEESFGRRFAELSVEFASCQEECRYGLDPGMTLCQLWTARNDAKSVVVLGDPAVRLAVDFDD